MKKRFGKKRDGYVDDYNAPTEPLPDGTVVWFQPPTQCGMPVDGSVPVVLQPYGNPSQSAPVIPYVHSPTTPAIPYCLIPMVQVQGQKDVKGQRSRERRFLPRLVSLCFIVMQLLLAVRFVVQLLGLSAATDWVDGVIFTSGLFIWPFQLLWSWVSTLRDIPVTDIELCILVAILTYGVLSRIIVRLLKFILNHHA